MGRHRLTQLGAVLAALALAACGGGGDGGGGGPPVIPPVTPSMAVNVTNNSFSPPNAGIAPGQTVTWTWNTAGQTHNVRWEQATGGLVNSMDMTTGTFQQQFNSQGVFHYLCTIHANMEGWVTVQ